MLVSLRIFSSLFYYFLRPYKPLGLISSIVSWSLWLRIGIFYYFILGIYVFLHSWIIYWGRFHHNVLLAPPSSSRYPSSLQYPPNYRIPSSRGPLGAAILLRPCTPPQTEASWAYWWGGRSAKECAHWTHWGSGSSLCRPPRAQRIRCIGCVRALWCPSRNWSSALYSRGNVGS